MPCSCSSCSVATCYPRRTSAATDLLVAAYYARRTVRRYLPVLAGLVFALIILALLRHGTTEATTPWGNAASITGTGAREALHDAILVRGAGPLDSRLWSLEYEVLLSLLLPLYIVIARRLPRFCVVQGLALLIG
jgi:peptidoglycan/LPS O-acetylase OafA/YrhL